MDENFKRILDNLPEKRSRSRLEPYADLIRELLRRHLTYREIATVLLDGFQIHVSISTLHDYVRRWSASTRKVVRTKAESAQQNERKDQTDVSTKTRKPNEEASVTEDEVQKRISALKSRPIPVTETKIFHYDPEQPLQISSRSPRKESDK